MVACNPDSEGRQRPGHHAIGLGFLVSASSVGTAADLGVPVARLGRLARAAQTMTTRGPDVTRKLAGALALVLGTTLLGGCSGEDDASPPPPPVIGDQTGPSPGPDASPEESAEAGPPATGDKAEDSVEVTAGEISVTGEQERLAADAFVRYTRVRLESFNRVSVDLPELSGVAIGDALAQVQNYVAQLDQRGHHTVGAITVNVSGVAIKGERASVAVCMLNTSADANRRDRIVETEIPPAYRGVATARWVATDTWLIEDVSIEFVSDCNGA